LQTDRQNTDENECLGEDSKAALMT